jgi:hypothetical protein
MYVCMCFYASVNACMYECMFGGHAMDQAFSRQSLSLSVEDQVRSPVSSCGICGGQRDTLITVIEFINFGAL